MFEISLKVNGREIGYLQAHNVGTDYAQKPAVTSYKLRGFGVCDCENEMITHIRKDGAVVLAIKALQLIGGRR